MMRVFFSSEIGILKSFLNIKFKPSKNEIYSFLALGYLQGNHTGYEKNKIIGTININYN